MTYTMLVGVDRDNTITFDRDAYFGSADDWKEHLEFVPGAIEGLRRLSKADHIGIAVLTAQVGIAKGVLSTQRVEEVNSAIDERLRDQGVEIDSWQYCPYVDQKGAERWESRGVKGLNYDFVLEDGDARLNLMKPKDGLLRRAAGELGLDYESLDKYVMGDRSSDALCGVNAGGGGILINNPAIPRGDSKYDDVKVIEEMVEDLAYQGFVFMVRDLNEAADIVLI